jgi:hypothetical protein
MAPHFYTLLLAPTGFFRLNQTYTKLTLWRKTPPQINWQIFCTTTRVCLCWKLAMS